MSGKKIEEKFNESSILKEATFSKCLEGIFKKSDELARQCNVDVDVLIVPPDLKPCMFESSCINSTAGHFQNVNPWREISSLALKQARIMKELEHEKVREKVLKKRKQELFQKYGIKEIKDMKFEELSAFKENLKALRQDIDHKLTEIKASSSQNEE